MSTGYVTVPPEAADELARTLVEERLAACVNRLPCRSVYRWEDEVVEEDEVVLVIKTDPSAWDRLVDRITELHPHDVPAIERFDEDDVHPPYRSWVRASTDVK